MRGGSAVLSLLSLIVLIIIIQSFVLMSFSFTRKV